MQLNQLEFSIILANKYWKILSKTNNLKTLPQIGKLRGLDICLIFNFIFLWTGATNIILLSKVKKRTSLKAVFKFYFQRLKNGIRTSYILKDHHGCLFHWDLIPNINLESISHKWLHSWFNIFILASFFFNKNPYNIVIQLDF